MKASQEMQDIKHPFDAVHASDDKDPLAGIIVDIVQTREVRTLLGNVAPELVRVWAGRSRVRRAMAGPVGNVIEKGLKNKVELESAKSAADLFDDPEVIGRIGEAMPGLIDGFIAGAITMGRYLETLPSADRNRYLAGLMANGGVNKAGAILTVYARVLNGMYAEDRRVLTETLMPVIEGWVEGTDFGELRDTLAYAGPDIRELVSRFWNVLGRYPAKLVTLLSVMPEAGNILVHGLKEALTTISDLFGSPDMITDFLLSVLRDIDGKSVGALVNALCELSRQLHVGSGLLGEPGSPIFRRDISAFLTDVVATVDAETLNKARRGIAEGRETVHRAFIDILRDNPDTFIQYLHTSNDIRNIRIKTMSQKVALIEDIPEDEMSRALEESVSGLNTHDMAEMINGISRTLNRIRAENPDFNISMIAEFVNGVDVDELQDAVKWITDELGEVFRPIGRIFAPPLVRMICGWATPEKDGFDQEVQAAVDALKNLLQSQEVEA